MSQDIITPLEAVVDRVGLFHTVTGLALMCFEKAAHIRANGTPAADRALIRQWEHDGRVLERAARALRADGGTH